jgi:hypothetical protein
METDRQSDSVRDTVSSEQAIVAKVVKNARRSYGGRIDDVTLVDWARKAVADLLKEPVKVTNFVPVLAMRAVDAEAAERTKSED